MLHIQLFILYIVYTSHGTISSYKNSSTLSTLLYFTPANMFCGSPHEKTTPTSWWRKRRTAEANVTRRAGRMEHNHNRTAAGCYNITKEGTSGQHLVRGRDFKNKNKNKF
jgi:hypothetical protein